MLIDAIQSAAERIEADIANGPIVPSVTPREIRAYLSARYDFQAPTPLEEVGADIEEMLRKWQVQVTHPRYFGLFNPSVSRASVVADALTALYNPQLATWRTSPAANEIERHTLSWMAGKFGLPADTAATFTTGGAEANLSAVVAALTRAFPGFGEDGLRSLTATPAIYLTSESHNSYNKIAHMTGLGRNALRTVAIGPDLKMDPIDLARKVAADREHGFAPFLVVGTAGTTGAGAIDPLPELARFCRAEDLWLHTDAAWGGTAILSPSLKGSLAGIELSDSITCDAHKWLSVSMGAGMFFCRHQDVLGEAFRAATSYMPGATGAAFDPYTMSVQWSRRFIGLKLFLTLAHEGEAGVVERIERQIQNGCFLRGLLLRSGWRIVNQTPLPLVCFTRDGLDIPHFLSALLQRQVAWMSQVCIGGTPVIRACITSFRTTESDIAWVVGEMNRIIQ